MTLSPEHLTQLWQQTEGNPKLLELSAGALIDLSVEAGREFHRVRWCAQATFAIT